MASAAAHAPSVYEFALYQDDSQWINQDQGAQSLPPADHGFPFTFGIFQAYYSNHELFSHESGSIAAIGTTATGVMYFGAPFIAVAAQRWPAYRKPSMAAGLVVMIISLIAASFCNSANGLIMTEGVLYAIGGLFAYFPAFQFIDEWFIARKGLAYGIMWAGTGMAGVIVPFLLQWLLDSYGFRTALRVWAVILTLLTVPAIAVVRPRLPVSSSSSFRRMELGFMRRSTFWVLMSSTIAQGFGLFIPTLWIPSFAETLHFPSFAGALGLALYNLFAFFGSMALGHLVDRVHVSNAMLIATLGQMLAIFVFWGCATNQAMLYLFAIIWGVFAGGSSATWSGCVMAVKKREGEGSSVDAVTVFSLMAAGKGIGAVISGPLSERLLEVGGKWHASLAYGSGYGILIVFTGISATLGGTAWLGKQLSLV